MDSKFARVLKLKIRNASGLKAPALAPERNMVYENFDRMVGKLVYMSGRGHRKNSKSEEIRLMHGTAKKWGEESISKTVKLKIHRAWVSAKSTHNNPAHGGIRSSSKSIPAHLRRFELASGDDGTTNLSASEIKRILGDDIKTFSDLEQCLEKHRATIVKLEDPSKVIAFLDFDRDKTKEKSDRKRSEGTLKREKKEGEQYLWDKITKVCFDENGILTNVPWGIWFLSEYNCQDSWRSQSYFLQVILRDNKGKFGKLAGTCMKGELNEIALCANITKQVETYYSCDYDLYVSVSEEMYSLLMKNPGVCPVGRGGFCVVEKVYEPWEYLEQKEWDLESDEEAKEMRLSFTKPFVLDDLEKNDEE